MSSSMPTTPAGGYLSFEGGSLGLLQGTAGFGGRSHDERATYALDFAHVNYTRGEDGHDDYRLTSGSARTTYQLTPRLGLFAKFAMGDSFAFLNQDPTPVPICRRCRRANWCWPFPSPNRARRSTRSSTTRTIPREIAAIWARCGSTIRPIPIGRRPLATRACDRCGLFGWPGQRRSKCRLGFPFPFWAATIRWRPGRALLAQHVSDKAHRFPVGASRLGANGVRSDGLRPVDLSHAARFLRAGSESDQPDERPPADRTCWAGAVLPPRRPSFSDATANPYGGVSHIDVPSSYNGDAAVAYRFRARIPSSGPTPATATVRLRSTSASEAAVSAPITAIHS